MRKRAGSNPLTTGLGGRNPDSHWEIAPAAETGSAEGRQVGDGCNTHTPTEQKLSSQDAAGAPSPADSDRRTGMKQESRRFTHPAPLQHHHSEASIPAANSQLWQKILQMIHLSVLFRQRFLDINNITLIFPRPPLHKNNCRVNKTFKYLLWTHKS